MANKNSKQCCLSAGEDSCIHISIYIYLYLFVLHILGLHVQILTGTSTTQLVKVASGDASETTDSFVFFFIKRDQQGGSKYGVHQGYGCIWRMFLFVLFVFIYIYIFIIIKILFLK